MKVYHRTPEAEAILNDGFRDGPPRGKSELLAGVFISNDPPQPCEGAKGMTTLALELPEEVVESYLTDYGPDGSCREYFLPASILNEHGPPEIHDHDFQGCKLTDISNHIAAWRRNGNDNEAGWLEDDIPLLQKHGLLAIEDDDSAHGFKEGK
jgi:hypothetical protein